MNPDFNKITIRGVSPTVLSKLDTLAAERHTSRNQLLCSLLENCLANMKFSESENHYADLVHCCCDTIERNTQVLQKFCFLVDREYAALCETENMDDETRPFV